jgi:hypothetical protein
MGKGKTAVCSDACVKAELEMNEVTAGSLLSMMQPHLTASECSFWLQQAAAATFLSLSLSLLSGKEEEEEQNKISV